MFVYALILILILLVTLLTVTIENSFSEEELNQMGICLENENTVVTFYNSTYVSLNLTPGSPAANRERQFDSAPG